MSIKSMDRVRSLAREAWAEEARDNARDAYARGIASKYERLLAEGREDEANAAFDAPAPDFVVPRGVS